MITVIPAGDAGMLIDAATPPALLAAAISRASLSGVRDVVPGAATVLVITDPGAWRPRDLAAAIEALPVPAPGDQVAAPIEIPVTYDGPDLGDVARLSGLPVAEVIRAHSGADYTVGWLGFSPGFGYLTGLDEALSTVPRLASPRLAIPAGSVAIAGGLSAVYPCASPGGWRIIGHTTTRMWDPQQDPPSLLAPGQLVRFRPVPPAASGTAAAGTAGISASPASTSPASTSPASTSPGSGPARPAPFLEVVRPGPLATVQDFGRPGLAAVGVPPSGAADPLSLAIANRLARNPDDAAGIELTLGRATFRCAGGATLATAGAPATVTISQSPGQPAKEVPFGAAFDVPDGMLVSIGAPVAGLRTYLAVHGGVATPVVLGSRSADLLSGLGGGPLRAGDVLPVGAQVSGTPPAWSDPRQARLPGRGGTTRLEVMAGPRADWFDADAIATLRGTSYTVSAASNRTGLRLDGPGLRRSRPVELPSEGMVTGSLQVPHDGQPILLLADHPTVGGYPVIAVLVSADIPLAAQLRPGDLVQFVIAKEVVVPGHNFLRDHEPPGGGREPGRGREPEPGPEREPGREPEPGLGPGREREPGQERGRGCGLAADA